MTEYERIVAARDAAAADARIAADIAWKHRALAYCPASPDGRHLGRGDNDAGWRCLICGLTVSADEREVTMP
jgi:hypothetical protein